MGHNIWDIFERVKAMRNNQLNPNSFRPSIIKSEQDVHQPTEESIVGQTAQTPPPQPRQNDDVDIVDPVETTSPVTIQNVNNTGDETAPSTSGLNRSTDSLTGSPAKRRKSSESNPRSPTIRSVTPIEHIANPNPESPGMHLKFCKIFCRISRNNSQSYIKQFS